MKKPVLILYILLFIILYNLIVCMLLNTIHINSYQKGNYSELFVKPLLLLNFSEPCVAHYNYGNVLYQKGQYDDAIAQYQTALNSLPSQEKECDIRVNLALSMLEKIDVKNLQTEDGKLKVIEELENIIEVLCEDGCAHKDDNNGHDKDAQTLKNEIEQIIESLKTTEETEEKNEEQQEEQQQEQQKEEKDPKEEKLEELLKQGQEERQSELEYAEDLYGYDYEYYGGKRW